MKTQTHTPSPWILAEPLGKESMPAVMFKTVGGMGYVCQVNKEEDAAYIVRAVNSFDAMTQALKACQVFLIDDELYAQTKELRATVESAIAKAEGK